jgi:hypothetical protein
MKIGLCGVLNMGIYRESYLHLWKELSTWYSVFLLSSYGGCYRDIHWDIMGCQQVDMCPTSVWKATNKLDN